jgi:hypothetical protein
VTRERKPRGRKKRKKANKGAFKKGFDPRRNTTPPPREACQRGWASTRAKLAHADPNVLAWFWRKIRSYFRSKGTWYPQENLDGQEEDSGPAGAGDD